MGLARWEQPPASSSFLRLCVDLKGLQSTIFTIEAEMIFSDIRVKHSVRTWNSKNIPSRFCFFFFPCCGCVGIRAPQIQSHMVSVCTTNYLEQKVFQDCYEPVLYLVSVFIPMISFTVRLSLWHSSYTMGKIFVDSRGNKQKCKLKKNSPIFSERPTSSLYCRF